LLAILARAVGLSTVGWVAGLTMGAAVAAALTVGLSRSGREGLGAANRVTLARAVLVGAIAALVSDGFVRATPVAAVIALAVPALLLDAIDGRVARRTDTVSPLGARFDMEVDALLILVLSIEVSRTLGAWVLAIGAARYALGAAGVLLPWLRAPSPARTWGKIVAAVQGITLTAAVAQVLPSVVTMVVVACALGMLAESFGRQVAWLWQYARVRSVRRPPRPIYAVPVPVRR
jgi:phosphatidylglycerophosphate synthase